MFARMVGVKPQTINTWEDRNSFDTDLLYSKCEGVSGDWLLSGEGEMMKSSRIEYIESDDITKLKKEVERLRKLTLLTRDDKALDVSMKFFEAAKEMFCYYNQMKGE